MCWNFDEGKVSRTVAFINDRSSDNSCDETPVSVELL